MSASVIPSRAMVTHAIDRHRWNEITDGAVLQEDGRIVEIGTYQELSRKHAERRGCRQRQGGDVAGVCQWSPSHRVDTGAARLTRHAARRYPLIYAAGFFQHQASVL
jgi:hypothetical protein